MFDLRKLFVREARAHKGDALDPDSDYNPSDRSAEGLEVEYQSLIATQFRRWGIASGSVSVEVRQLGRAPDGFDVFVGMVRLGKWDRISALRLLIGLPLLEAKVRKTVRATWLADYSHFGGLWLHASEQLHASGDTAELRELLLKLTPGSSRSRRGAEDSGPGSFESSLRSHGGDSGSMPLAPSVAPASGGAEPSSLPPASSHPGEPSASEGASAEAPLSR